MTATTSLEWRSSATLLSGILSYFMINFKCELLCSFSTSSMICVKITFFEM